MAAIGEDGVASAAKGSPLYDKYGETIDRESAYEMLTTKIALAPVPSTPPQRPAEVSRPERDEPGVVEQILSSPVTRSFLRSLASSAGREITRGLFGTRRR
jgi:uncharacterized protein